VDPVSPQSTNKKEIWKKTKTRNKIDINSNFDVNSSFGASSTKFSFTYYTDFWLENVWWSALMIRFKELVTSRLCQSEIRISFTKYKGLHNIIPMYFWWNMLSQWKHFWIFNSSSIHSSSYRPIRPLKLLDFFLRRAPYTNNNQIHLIFSKKKLEGEHIGSTSKLRIYLHFTHSLRKKCDRYLE
jgi:hypothetical protein